MSTRNSSAIIPQYMRDFSCIGSACEDSCCIGWKVSIDEDTYKKYNRVRDKDLTFTLQKKVTRNRSNPSPNNYAKIKMEQDGSCPFLDTEKLCSIQKKLGEEYLSTTCATYPRMTRNVNDVLEQSGTVSCPEIARLALLNPDGIEFDEVQNQVDGRSVNVGSLDTSDIRLKNSPKKYLWELRIFTISLLQNRMYPLQDRLIILGMFYNKLSELINEKQLDQIPTLISSYTNIVESGSLRESLNGIPTQQNLQMELIKAMTDERFRMGIKNERFLQCFTEALLGLGYVKDSLYADVAAKYSEMISLYYEPFMNEHEYIMENYLVNHVFKNTFPFSEYENVFEEYVMLVVHFSIIKMLFIGVGGYHKGMTTDLAVKIIQSFSKMFEHNKSFLTKMSDTLKKNGYTSMAYMSILIKN
ncbi:hypothetical protein BK133_10300 [Paenibacillus sp. FSL H8-0548]|uniref:flagellin lysine-N-methylase n=1 Tax=Paenibacillus sp. FSL H8-0548 TaxID=1920422 RepID=UPI00096EB509|nr:flagellin lysine-N-methylase [Paenibacillus sp. FSL H8-0548]OMF35832.1 hypothetical protein BK133_10300 [Paenibacillus sp. FSL H8-0548]